jgi:hypothetical protein
MTIQISFFCVFHAGRLDCFVARAPRNDGVMFPLASPRHCEPTGPREARPDDRLREAIQRHAARGLVHDA